MRRALAIAQSQSYRAHALRAATSLAHLLDGVGRGTEARAVLATELAAFTEGAETEDMDRARILLGELL